MELVDHTKNVFKHLHQSGLCSTLRRVKRGSSFRYFPDIIFQMFHPSPQPTLRKPKVDKDTVGVIVEDDYLCNEFTHDQFYIPDSTGLPGEWLSHPQLAWDRLTA